MRRQNVASRQGQPGSHPADKYGMSVIKRKFIQFGASVMTTRISRRLKTGTSALRAQETAYKQLIKRIAGTAFGQDSELDGTLPYDVFRRRVPLRVYEEFHPYIDRIKAGEPNILWPGTCSLFASTSGTTFGRAKLIPMTEALLQHFQKAGRESLLYYTARVGHTGVLQGRHLYLGGSATPTPIDGGNGHTAFACDLSGIATLNLPKWADEMYYEPGDDIARISDWQQRINAIADRTAGKDITLLGGIPNWIMSLGEAVLARSVQGKIRPTYLKAVWPNLECLVHGGVPIAPFADGIRLMLGPHVNFHEVYPSCEGFIAAQDADATFGLRLMTDVGIFFEFLPMREYVDARLGPLGNRTIPLSAVKTGVDYALVMTTPGGFCRYVMGDVVRFVSTDIPRLIYVGRTKLQLNLFGEQVIEKQLTDALLSVCQQHGWTIVNFHVAPLFSDAPASGTSRGRHEWWIELKTPTVVTPTGPVIAAELDAELQRINSDYATQRSGRNFEPPVVRLVMPGLFEQWMRTAGKWGGLGRMPRCRSDRHVAEELSLLARFSNDA